MTIDELKLSIQESVYPVRLDGNVGSKRIFFIFERALDAIPLPVLTGERYYQPSDFPLVYINCDMYEDGRCASFDGMRQLDELLEFPYLSEVLKNSL